MVALLYRGLQTRFLGSVSKYSSTTSFLEIWAVSSAHEEIIADQGRSIFHDWKSD